MHVKISSKGREILNDRELASKLVETVMNNKTELEKGERVRINGGNMGVKLVTTLKESTGK